ncbi:MAG: ATP-binding cassette domain-containing protein [Firmicutes bacterium]|nr:ATP-binding cassette domain-containing protein [Bacillota bacterium]
MIQVENLTKCYGQHTAINQLTFTVGKGEILGFLGPNGAGKSTTMNIITGYTSATSGSVKVDGLDILKEPRTVKAKIGYLPEFPPLYGEMTVKEYLGFVGDIKSVSKAEKDECFEKIVDLVKISDVWDRLIKNLSKGYKQRIGLAQALIGNPQILILDEPTVGLDPKQIIEIRNLIKELSKEHTIILSSHILTEVSAVCERVIIINKGKIVAGDTPENLGKSLSASSKLALRVAGPKDQVINILSKLTGVKELLAQGVKEPNTIDILITAEGDIDLRRPIFSTLSQANYPILMMRSLDLTLEDIFLHVTTEEEPIEEVS